MVEIKAIIKSAKKYTSRKVVKPIQSAVKTLQKKRRLKVVESCKKKLSVLRIEPINFSIRNDKDREIVVRTFQHFLNSLDFPVQIVVATDSLNLDTYLAKKQEEVDSTKNATYKHIFKDFKEHLLSTIAKKGLLNRSFYLIVPERENLAVQMEVCEQLLTNMNLHFTKLDDEELTLLLSGFFQDVYSEQPTTKDDYFFSSIAPSKFINHVKDVKIDDTYVRTIAVRGYPRIVEEGFLDKIITLNGKIDISLHIEPYDIEETMVMLNKQLQKQRGDLWAMEQKDIINPVLEIQYDDTRKVLEHLQKGNEKLFNISLYISCKASTRKELDVIARKVESQLNAMLMLPYTPQHIQHKAFKSVLPLGENELGIRRNITTGALSAFFPFTSQFLQIDESGILLGLNRNNIPIIKDIFKLYNANGVVLASSGGGKSYFTKLMISRSLLNGTKVMVIDPQGEYVDLVKKFDGQLVTVSRTSSTIINPLDLMGHDFDEKKLTLLELFPLMIGDMSEVQKAVLDKALTIVYDECGITNNPKTWRRKPPILGDLLRQLKKMSKTATKIEMETYRSLINRVEMYVTGVFSFLNKQTKINFNNNFVCFNIGDMPNQVKPVIMFLMLDYVYMKMKKDINRKLLVIDEAWSLLQRAEDEGYIFKIVKTARKFNLGLLLITQDVGDLVKNNAGKALLNNSEYTLLLRQKPSIIDEVQKTFHLSTRERDRLLTATTGEGILIINNEHSEIKIIASPEEHQVITTNADERLASEEANEVVTAYEEPTLDYQKGWFKTKELTQDEIEELLERGYRLSLHIGLEGGARVEYLLKPRSNESCEHFFVTKVIEEYISKYCEVELNPTNGADIVFNAGKKKIGIEVETGSLLRKAPKSLQQKIIDNKKRYDEWFFVVTNVKRDKDKYAKLHETFVRRDIPEVIKRYNLNSEKRQKKPKSQNSNSEGRSSETAKFAGIGTQISPINRPTNKRGSKAI